MKWLLYIVSHLIANATRNPYVLSRFAAGQARFPHLARVNDSEVILKPQRIFADPFRPRSDGQKNILVMCDTYTPAGEPLETNTRAFGT